jgi:hypothetical protein
MIHKILSLLFPVKLPSVELTEVCIPHERFVEEGCIQNVQFDTRLTGIQKHYLEHGRHQ